MSFAAVIRSLLVAGSLAVAGCAAPGGGGVPLGGHAVELTETPFFPQRAYHCGPAALATVLGASGVPVDPDELASSLYIPERHGTLQVELTAAARRRGRLAVVLEGGLPALVRQLQAGRPVLVLQNLAVSFYPVWHYAVVVGYQPEPERFVLRSGGEERQLTSRARFEATWRRADHWGLVVLAPEAEPQGLGQGAYLRAAADLENTGANGAALKAFRAAVEAWPSAALARLGEANNLYYLGRRDAAVEAYRRLLSSHPGHPVAVHNLTMLLLELERPCEARAVITAADGLEGALVETARRAAGDAASSCPDSGRHPPLSLN